MSKTEDTGETGRIPFRESEETRADNVWLDQCGELQTRTCSVSSGDPDEEQQHEKRLSCDVGKFSSRSSGTNDCADHQRTGYSGDGLHKGNKN